MSRFSLRRMLLSSLGVAMVWKHFEFFIIFRPQTGWSERDLFRCRPQLASSGVLVERQFQPSCFGALITPIGVAISDLLQFQGRTAFPLRSRKRCEVLLPSLLKTATMVG